MIFKYNWSFQNKLFRIIRTKKKRKYKKRIEFYQKEIEVCGHLRFQLFFAREQQNKIRFFLTVKFINSVNFPLVKSDFMASI